MTAFAWILLLTASTVVNVVDQAYQIPANKWQYVPVGLHQKPAMVYASYTVESGPPQVRLALMRHQDVERLRDELPHGVIEETEFGASGSVIPHVCGAGEYAVVVDNQGDTPASVRLRVWLDFGVPPGREVTQLSPKRQLVVILLSFATFFGIVTWSARRLLRGIRQ
jgi:hypothetical protein